MKVIVANTNPTHVPLEQSCKEQFGAIIIHDKEELSFEKVSAIKPDYIFFPHWSHIIPKSIFDGFTCVVFHMTDLPFGRGGSPLQNLIVRGHTETMISALKVDDGLDTGPVYLKRKLSLEGTAEEIFLRAGKIMIEMVKDIIANRIEPVQQTGHVVEFKRRKPEEGSLQKISELEKIYDFIRMLDAEGYPKAFIETEFFKFEFSRASLKRDGINAEVKITKK